MNATITHTIEVCDDCVQVIANAATSADTGYDGTDLAAEGIVENWGSARITLDDGYTTFATSTCEGCASRDAGGRTPASVWDHQG